MAVEHLGTRDVPIADLTFFPGNARRGNVDEIRKSVRRLGQYRSVAVRDTGDALVILAGNHTVQAMQAEGFKTVHCGIIRCTDDEALRVNISDNRLGELPGPDGFRYDDDDELVQLLSYLEDDYEGTGWTAEDVDALIGADDELPAGGGDPDDVPEPPEEPVSALGDLYLLGPHRLLCGDADDVTAHDRLLGGDRPHMLFVDPPYGMNLQTDYTKVGHGQGKAYERIAGDDRPFDASSLIALYGDVAEQFWWGADYYRATIPAGGSWIVWDKRGNDEGMDLDLLFGSVFELCWSRQPHKRDIARVLWAMTHGTQRAIEDVGRGLHPSQKPVALVAWFLSRYGKHGDVILDCYAGSGTTLMGCEQAGRQARLMELSEAYTDTICARWERATGIKPERVLPDGTTEPVSFAA